MILFDTTFGENLGYRRGEVACPTLQNGMLLQFFEHLLLIFRDFRCFSLVWMHLEASGKQEGTGGWASMPKPSKWCVTWIFWTYVADISLFFAILGVFHVFGCTWKV